MKPRVAVIILNWNGARLLRRFLPSVVANTPDELGRVIVADNGSTDESLRVLSEEFPEVEVLRFAENYGFAEGYNRAVAACSDYPYVLLLNSDVETPQGWLQPLVEAMDADPTLGACQPKILSYNDKPKRNASDADATAKAAQAPAKATDASGQEASSVSAGDPSGQEAVFDTFEYAGASGGFIDCNGYPYCRGRIFSVVEQDRGQYDDQIDIFWATGAALMVRTELYLRAGGLDKRFFAHMEEIDLCWRIHLLDSRIAVVPASRVYHLGGGSLPASNPRKTYLNFRNNLLLLYKNLPVKDLKRTLLRRRLLDTLAWAKFVATLDFANAAAVVKAHRDFRKMRREYTAHPERNLLGRFPGTKVNILTSFYLRGRRRFSLLDL